MASQSGWEVPIVSEDEVRDSNLLCMVGEEIDAAYLAQVKDQLIDADAVSKGGRHLRVVYTPLHGAGCYIVPQLMSAIGFSDFHVVPSQSESDGDFPTVDVPNPEEPAAFAESIALAAEIGAEVVLATDPDGDRTGVYCRRHDGSYRRFTGNEVGVLMAWSLLSRRGACGSLPRDGQVIKSIVSTALAKKVTDDFGVELVEVPVGFKYTGEKIKEMEEAGHGTFLWGFEESLGYLTGTYARDKDGVLAVALVCEAALYYKGRGCTLDEVMTAIYERYGYFLDDQVAFAFEGSRGRERIETLMQRLRQDERHQIGTVTVTSREDYLSGTRLDETGTSHLDFPSFNLFRFSFADGGFIMARPSGTEPKIRFYFCVGGADRQTAEANLKTVKDDFFAPLQNLLS